MEITNWKNEDWYQQLIEEIRSDITESVWQARWGIISSYHRIGTKIIEHVEDFSRSKIYGDNIVKNISLDLGKGTRTIYYAIQFVKKFPDLDRLPGGKNMSWRQVLSLLPGGDEHPKPLTLEERLMMFATPEVKKNPKLPYASTLPLHDLIIAKPVGEKKIVVIRNSELTMTTNLMMAFFKQTYGMKKMFGEQDVSRFACQRLLKAHGEDKLKQMIQAAHAIHDKSYAPKVTSFLDLEKKLYELSVYFKREKGKSSVAFIQR